VRIEDLGTDVLKRIDDRICSDGFILLRGGYYVSFGFYTFLCFNSELQEEEARLLVLW
jgi:hypothetical protein